MRRVVFDSDTASDDSIAILYAHKKFRVEAVTIVSGNVSFEHQVRNALFTLEYFGFDTPVYLGSKRPILGLWKTAEEVHGTNGLGGWKYPDPKRKPERGFAPDILVDLSRRYEGELEILAVSPLTNIALAYLKDPGIVERISKVWIMGGAFYQGNTTMSAEFNFWVDPEAAKIVLSAGFDITIVPWEVAVDAATIKDDEWTYILERGTQADKFFIQANKVSREYSKSKGGGGCVQPDSLTVAIANDRRLVLESGMWYADVETCSTARGTMLVDFYSNTGKAPNVEIVRKADRSTFMKTLIEDVLA